MDLTKKVTIAPEVLSQQVGGEMVLLDLQGENYFGLNAVGSRIWELLNADRNLQQVFDTLLDEYEINPDQLRADLEEIIRDLEKADLITLGSNG